MATITHTTKKASAIETGIEGSVLTLTFANGKRLEVSVGQLNEEVKHAALIHGLKQKLCDAAAISRDPATGRTATIDTKFDAVADVFNRIIGPDGEWNKKREAGSVGSGGLLLAALVRMYAGRKTRDDLREFLDGKSLAEQAALRKNKRVAEIIEEIKAERAANDDSEDNSDAMLDELDD